MMGDVKMCYLTGNWPQPDDFCSMGERRTGKEEPVREVPNVMDLPLKDDAEVEE